VILAFDSQVAAGAAVALLMAFGAVLMSIGGIRILDPWMTRHLGLGGGRRLPTLIRREPS